MSEENPVLHRCCFTGHRPEKMQSSEDDIKKKLKSAIISALNDGYATFITGMAPGVDIWAAEIVLEAKKVRSGIHLICAIPFPGFCKRRDYNYNLRAKRILEQADFIKAVSPAYSKSSYQKRNEYMVDHSNLVIAVFTGAEGGTANTIEYARKHGKEINLISVT